MIHSQAAPNGFDEEVSIDDLPRTSAWPARLLGLEPWAPKQRSSEHIQREYDLEKYGKVLAWLERTPPGERSFGAAQALIDSRWRTGKGVVSHHDRLYAVERAAFDVYQTRLHKHALLETAGDTDAIVELGCGFGFQLHALRAHTKLPLAGGELSKNAVHVAAGLLRDEDAMTVTEFDFHDAASYARVLDACTGRRVTIFTSHAVSMLPTALPFLENIRRHRDRVARVVHLEPATGLFEAPTLLDQLRKAYARVNDYNQDLFELLSSAKDIEIVRREKDVLGQNPLTPFNLIEWRFSGH